MLTEPGVCRGVQYLQGHVGYLERAVLLHLDLGHPGAVRLAPGQPVPGVQRHRGLIPLGHCRCGRGVGPVAMGADHGEDLPVTDRVEHRGGVLARVHDDHLLVVADHPGVVVRDAGLYPFDSRLHQAAFLLIHQ